MKYLVMDIVNIVKLRVNKLLYIVHNVCVSLNFNLKIQQSLKLNLIVKH